MAGDTAQHSTSKIDWAFDLASDGRLRVYKGNTLNGQVLATHTHQETRLRIPVCTVLDPPDSVLHLAQAKNSVFRQDFSPMTSFDADGIKPTEKSSPLRAPDHWNFESYWQSRKVHLQNGKQASPEKKQQIKDWWLKNEKPKRRCTIALPNHTQIPFGHGYVLRDRCQ